MAGVLSMVAGTGIAALSELIKDWRGSKLNKASRGITEDAIKENQAWWDIKRPQDYTARSDVQAAINRQRQILNEQYRNARATNVVAGGTDASLALQKEAANRSLAQTSTDVASNAAAWKDSNEDKYRARDAALKDQLSQSYQQQAAAIAQAGSQAVSSGIQLAGQGAYLNELDKAGVLRDMYGAPQVDENGQVKA